jgi:hypothetical protein
MYLELADEPRPHKRLFAEMELHELSKGGRGWNKFKNFVNKVAPIGTSIGLSVVPGGGVAKGAIKNIPKLATTIQGAGKLIAKHKGNAAPFLKGIFAAKKGQTHKGVIPVAVPANASPAEMEAAQDAAEILNNPRAGNFVQGRQASSPKPSFDIQKNLPLILAAGAAVYFISKKR